MTRLRRAALLAVLVAIAATLAPPAHSATTAVGLYSPASVTCNAITNTIQVQAHFGAGMAYADKTQRLGYQLYLYNGRQWEQLGPTWHMIDHTRLQWIQTLNEFGVLVWRPSDNPWANTPNLTYYRSGTAYEGDGTYYVAVRYIWLHNGVWLDRNGNRFTDSYSPWEYTTSYMNTSGSGAACRI
jgi:hypothetical protein